MSTQKKSTKKRTPMERAQLEKIEAGFAEAITLIRTWQGMGAKGTEEKQMWDIYYNHSPEMKRVREAHKLLQASDSVAPVMRSCRAGIGESYHDVTVMIDGQLHIISDNYAYRLECTRCGGWQLRRIWDGRETLLGEEFGHKDFKVLVNGIVICASAKA